MPDDAEPPAPSATPAQPDADDPTPRHPPFRRLRRVARQRAGELRGYNANTLRCDLVAAASVCVVAIPQAIAYALIAEVPPVYGLYTLVLQCAIGALLSSQPLLSAGPINTQSLLVAAIATRLADPADATETYVQLVVGLTLIKGVIQLALVGLNVGGLARYVSHSVIVGFTAGAGVLIAAGQLAPLLGVAKAPRAGTWPGLVGEAQRLLPNLHSVHAWSLAVGAAALATMLLARALSKPLGKRLPGPPLAVLVGGLAVAALPLLGVNAPDVAMVPALPAGPPPIGVPLRGMDVPTIEALLPGALALALLGLLEAYAIGKTLAAERQNLPPGLRVSANQELLSQGVAHTVGSFFGSIPGSGSFSRSALNAEAGAQTFLAGVFNAALVLLVFLLLGDWASRIPLPVIAAILLVVAYGLIDWRYLVQVRRSNPADAWTCLGTFAATLTLPLAYAVFVGIALNLALYLRRARQVYITQMIQDDTHDHPPGETHLLERPLREHWEDRAIVFLQVEGNLFFAASDDLQGRFAELLAGPAQAVILRLKRTHLVDATVMSAIQRFAEQMQARGRHVLLCGLRERMLERMDAFGLVDAIGRDNVFASDDEPFHAARLAVERAQHLTGLAPNDAWSDKV